MTSIELRKQGKNWVHVAPIERSPEELFERELAEVGLLAVGKGKERPKRMYKIAEDELHPGRTLARLVSDALGALCDPVALYHAIERAIRGLIERKTRRKLPQPPQYKALPGA